MSNAGKEAARARYRREQRQALRLEFIKAAMQGLCARETMPGNIEEMAVKIGERTLKTALEDLQP